MCGPMGVLGFRCAGAGWGQVCGGGRLGKHEGSWKAAGRPPAWLAACGCPVAGGGTATGCRPAGRRTCGSCRPAPARDAGSATAKPGVRLVQSSRRGPGSGGADATLRREESRARLARARSRRLLAPPAGAAPPLTAGRSASRSTATPHSSAASSASGMPRAGSCMARGRLEGWHSGGLPLSVPHDPTSQAAPRPAHRLALLPAAAFGGCGGGRWPHQQQTGAAVAQRLPKLGCLVVGIGGQQHAARPEHAQRAHHILCRVVLCGCVERGGEGEG